MNIAFQKNPTSGQVGNGVVKKSGFDIFTDT
jgi:hypothetical protein